MFFRLLIAAAVVVGIAVVANIYGQRDHAREAAMEIEYQLQKAQNRHSNPFREYREEAARLAGSHNDFDYKYEYQEADGSWVKVREFSEIPQNRRGRFRILKNNNGSSGAKSYNNDRYGSDYGENNNRNNLNLNSAAETDNSDMEYRKTSLDIQMENNEAKYRAMAQRCISLGRLLDSKNKELTRLEANPPNCMSIIAPDGSLIQLDSNCDHNYTARVINLRSTIETLDGQHDDCLTDARRAGVPPGYLR